MATSAAYLHPPLSGVLLTGLPSLDRCLPGGNGRLARVELGGSLDHLDHAVRDGSPIAGRSLSAADGALDNHRPVRSGPTAACAHRAG